MKKKKLVSMIDFILEIDWMTTTEFCQETGAPMPNVREGVNSFLQVDAIKHRMFVEYAKFLNKDLTIEMFEGEKRIFEDGKYVNRQPSIEWNTYEINGIVVFRDVVGSKNAFMGKKVKDLAGLGIMYKSN